MRDLRLRPCFAAAGTLVTAMALAGCSGAGAASIASSSTRIEVSGDRCGSGWTDPVPGPQRFVLDNTDTRAGEVYLTDARSGDVYAEVDPLAAGTTQTVDITLGAEFGELDGEIDGLPDGRTDRTADPSWTGFHRLEYGLWHGQDAAILRPVAAALAASVDARAALRATSWASRTGS